MTLLFLGLDGLDHELLQRFKNFDFSGDEDIPVNLQHLNQNLKDVLSEEGQEEALYGHWTFYIWGAIASGQLRTPQMRQEHPLPSEVEYPLNKNYLLNEPKALLNWVKGRVKRRHRYRSMVFDSFENVKVINYPLSLPEYNRNTALFKDDATSRDYGDKELEMLAAEINDAIDKNYDAVFAVTRAVDCICHGATAPGNFDATSYDEMMENVIGKSFDEWHEGGMDAQKYIERREVETGDGQAEDKEELVSTVMSHVETSYGKLEQFVRSLNWEEVDNHVVISDHGFDKLGAGSVRAHGRHAVLSSDFCSYRKMSDFILNWRDDLQDALEDQEEKNTGEEFEGDSTEEKVKEELEKLGYV